MPSQGIAALKDQSNILKSLKIAAWVVPPRPTHKIKKGRQKKLPVALTSHFSII
jgi:hypothetical protein